MITGLARDPSHGFLPGAVPGPHRCAPGPHRCAPAPHGCAPVPLPAPAPHPTFRAIRELRSPR
ncbi:hypothetical protein RKD29_003140 [Streptomyces tendae]